MILGRGFCGWHIVKHLANKLIVIVNIENIAASEAISDTIFDDSRTTRAPADVRNPVPADIIVSQTKIVWAGELAIYG